MQPKIRDREPFQVNFTRTEVYRKSTIPTCQRLLNTYYMEHPERLGNGEAPGGGLRGEEGRGGGGGEQCRERLAGN